MVVCPLAQTCSDIITHRATLHLLDYGVKHLLRAATGTTSNVREAGKREDRKSIGVERSFKDLWKKEDLIAKLEDIAEHLCEDMEQLHFTARCLSLKFKTHDYKRAFSSLDHFLRLRLLTYFRRPTSAVFTRDRTLHHGELKSKESILKVGLQLLEENLPMRVRLLGLRVTHLKDLKVTKKGALDRVRHLLFALPHLPHEIVGCLLEVCTITVRSKESRQSVSNQAGGRARCHLPARLRR